MRLCFLVEEHYRHDGMPVEVIRTLTSWGHRVDVVRPGGSLLDMTEAVRAGAHDAWVLKTVSGGPGLTLLEAAAEAGLTTVNDARAIRRVRDKALAAAVGRGHGLPVPRTFAAADPQLLLEIPESAYPLVVKPADGSAGRSVHLVRSPGRLAALLPALAGEGMLIAQPYVANSGVDLKVYCIDGRLYATERRSPLHPERTAPERRVPLPAEVAEIVRRVGSVYGLDLYGVDVLLGPDGPVVVDVNDFPSFRRVPDAAAQVAQAILGLARRGAAPTSGAAVGATVDAAPATSTGTTVGATSATPASTTIAAAPGTPAGAAVGATSATPASTTIAAAPGTSTGTTVGATSATPASTTIAAASSTPAGAAVGATSTAAGVLSVPSPSPPPSHRRHEAPDGPTSPTPRQHPAPLTSPPPPPQVPVAAGDSS